MPNMSAVNAPPAPNPIDALDSIAATSITGIAALVADDLRAVEARLAERLESPVGAIPQVGSHLLGAGGKRLRPLLSVLAARAAGAAVEHGVAVGCAAELIHTATL